MPTVVFKVSNIGPHGGASIVHTNGAPCLAVSGECAQWLFDEVGYGELKPYRKVKTPIEFGNGDTEKCWVLEQKSDGKMLGFFTKKLSENDEMWYVRVL